MNGGNITLIEPGVKYFLNETLKNCQKNKYNYYSEMTNIILFLVFFILLGGILYYLYGEKLRKEKKREISNLEKQQYVINLSNKMKDIKMDKYKQKNMITDLPEFTSEFEITMKKFL